MDQRRGEWEFFIGKTGTLDCDNDTLLIKVEPQGPACHTGADTCWSERNHKEDFLYYLEIIELRKKSSDEKSYVRQLFRDGINKIAQKVGEDGRTGY